MGCIMYHDSGGAKTCSLISLFIWKLMSGGEHEGGDLCADEERGGEQAHRQDEDERPQQSLPHNIQVHKFLEDINRLI